MAKTTWSIYDTVQPQDMNDIGQEINQLRSDVDNIEVPPASLTKAGIVQLSNATNGTREDRAATEKALGEVMQEAQAGKQAGIDRKAEVVAALNSIGVTASTSESWAQLIPKMASIIRATGNAAVGDVLVGKTFSNATGNNRTGTMPNQGAQAITPGTGNKAIPAGYHNGSGYVAGDADLVAGNIPKDVNLFGVQGILERLTTADRNAIIAAIVGKGVAASASDSNAVLAQKIGQIVIGKKFASGTTSPEASTFDFNMFPSGTVRFNRISVSGLTFKPTFILVYYPDNGAVITYKEGMSIYGSATSDISVLRVGGNGAVGTGNIIKSTGPAIVTEVGFSLPVTWNTGTHFWFAFE
ncbi:phage tail protein [Paenibacillus sp. FSL R5-0407]|uniref:phage tail protein n=1 Tax=Paenibacillus sp. FSL R5-0407 TaxID=2975320 RepID=UPI0030FCDD23